ncbi:hypothetical protein MHBO_004006 [Bonamia ostreae]|uniref:Uncharacterized protein n=1 Tax=Bonamia ostreae TaxID=126728 RepID=A0ABV2AS35_9EUKA
MNVKELSNIISICSASYLNLDFDDKIQKSKTKFQQKNLILLESDEIHLSETKDYKAAKIFLNEKRLYAVFIAPKNEIDIKTVLENLSDPLNWNQLVKSFAKPKQKQKLLFPEIFLRGSNSLSNKNFNRFCLNFEDFYPENFEKQKFCLFNISLLTSPFVDDLDEENERNKYTKKDVYMCLTSNFIVFVHHSKSSAMIFSGIVNPSEMTKDSLNRKKKDVKYRAGRSPPRGDKSHVLTFSKTLEK